MGKDVDNPVHKVTLFDQGDPAEGHDKRVAVEVEEVNGTLIIRPEGYGDLISPDGKGGPVAIEIWEGELRLIVWGEINEEEYTHIISLEGSLESKREES